MLIKYIREVQYLSPLLLSLIPSEGKITSYDDHTTTIKATTKSLLELSGLRKTGGSLGQGVYFWATTTDQIIRKLFSHPPYCIYFCVGCGTLHPEQTTGVVYITGQVTLLNLDKKWLQVDLDFQRWSQWSCWAFNEWGQLQTTTSPYRHCLKRG